MLILINANLLYFDAGMMYLSTEVTCYLFLSQPNSFEKVRYITGDSFVIYFITT